MTAIFRAQIPDAALVSLETLAAWALTGLGEVNAGTLVSESPGESSFVVNCGPWLIATGAQASQWRLIVRASVPLSPDWRSTGPVWKAVLPLSDDPLPARLLA